MTPAARKLAVGVFGVGAFGIAWGLLDRHGFMTLMSVLFIAAFIVAYFLSNWQLDSVLEDRRELVREAAANVKAARSRRDAFKKELAELNQANVPRQESPQEYVSEDAPVEKLVQSRVSELVFEHRDELREAEKELKELVEHHNDLVQQFNGARSDYHFKHFYPRKDEWPPLSYIEG